MLLGVHDRGAVVSVGQRPHPSAPQVTGWRPWKQLSREMKLAILQVCMSTQPSREGRPATKGGWQAPGTVTTSSAGTAPRRRTSRTHFPASCSTYTTRYTSLSLPYALLLSSPRCSLARCAAKSTRGDSVVSRPIVSSSYPRSFVFFRVHSSQHAIICLGVVVALLCCGARFGHKLR